MTDLDPRYLPDDESLSRGLTTILGMDGPEAGKLAIIDREPDRAGSHPSEVVTCRTADGMTIRLLCKYGSAARRAGCHGHRSGVAYESFVYGTVLRALGLTVPHCYGSYHESREGRIWLVLDHLAPVLRVGQDPNHEAIISAADWLGRFHALAEASMGTEMASLRRHDRGYYRECARRAVDFTPGGRHETSWLRTLCERADEIVGALLRGPSTVIHGEFYPANVLIYEGRIVPVDWETAAVAAGEIDLASLVEGWQPEVVRRCEEQYVQARWPSRLPHGFQRALAAARVYWPLRWLGYRPGWLPESTRDHYLRELRAAAERLEVV